jgi:hypothetical protein
MMMIDSKLLFLYRGHKCRCYSRSTVRTAAVVGSSSIWTERRKDDEVSVLVKVSYSSSTLVSQSWISHGSHAQGTHIHRHDATERSQGCATRTSNWKSAPQADQENRKRPKGCKVSDLLRAVCYGSLLSRSRATRTNMWRGACENMGASLRWWRCSPTTASFALLENLLIFLFSNHST